MGMRAEEAVHGHVRRVIRGRVVAICIVDLQRVVKGA